MRTVILFFILGLAAAEINRRHRNQGGKNNIFLKSDTLKIGDKELFGHPKIVP